MSNEKVKVLLSAYNGEKYIKEQIDSIINQSYLNIELLVRDDGSSDGTIAILEEYEKKGQLTLIKGENLGFEKSFFSLIENAGQADFYAFSDQDDVWFPDKIAMAVERIKQADLSKPVLYFSNFDFYDGDMNFIAHHDSSAPKTCFRNSLVDCVPLGFNSVFNKVARDITVCHMPVASTGHDWWMYMLCSGLGEIVYDERPTVKYRRHNANVSGEEKSFLQFQIWRFKRFFLNGYFKKIHEQIKEFEDYHGSELSEENQKVLRMLSMNGFHPVNYFKKIFYPGYYRQKLLDEIFIRIIMLIGQL